MGVNQTGGSLLDKQVPIAFNDKRNKASLCYGLWRTKLRQLSHKAFLTGDAKAHQRTRTTQGLFWRADKRSQFH